MACAQVGSHRCECALCCAGWRKRVGLCGLAQAGEAHRWGHAGHARSYTHVDAQEPECTPRVT